MASAKITAVGFGHGGTQLKLSMKLDGNQIVAFKPKRYLTISIINYVMHAHICKRKHTHTKTQMQ